MSNDYFEELEKIANELVPEDTSDPMLEDPKPDMPPEEVEALQAQHADEANPAPAEEQLPVSPEDQAALEASVAEAERDLQEAVEHQASVLEQVETFEKTAAPVLADSLPAMGAFAKLIDFSTNQKADPALHKLAQERLQTALTSEESLIDTLHKTAYELFEDPQNLDALYTEEGMAYINEQLASFMEDDGLSKLAFEGGNIISKVTDVVKDFGSSTKNYWKLKKELQAANEAVNELDGVYQQKKTLFNDIRASGVAEDDPALIAAAAEQLAQGSKVNGANIAANELQRQVGQGRIGLGIAGSGTAAGALFGGKKLYDATRPDPEEELPVKVAGVHTNQQSRGGNLTMAHSVVNDFLKIAGAAALMNYANDPSLNEGIRKEAADQFNHIARLSRAEMDEAFVKVATQLYPEDQLHEIVAGYHTGELLDKVAFFLAANDASADELEKVAGADGVAAKGVAGALTDAKKNVEEHIKQDKEKSETNPANQASPADKAQDTSRYNVINNPAKYDVEKTAMLEQAHFQKQAAINAYVEAENFLRSYGY